MSIRFKLVQHTLGSEWKNHIESHRQTRAEYEIRRILNERPDVYVDEILQQGVSLRGSIISNLYIFGQKDLSALGGFEKDVVEKLVGDNLSVVRNRIEIQRQRLPM